MKRAGDVAGEVEGAVVGAGAPVLRLAQDGPRDVVFSVPEDRAGRLRAAMMRQDALSVRLTGAQGQTVKARIREIGAAADPTTRTFLVKADIGAAPIRLGQTATVLVDEPATAGVIRLPLTSVFEHQGQSTVWLLDRKALTVKKRPKWVIAIRLFCSMPAAEFELGDIIQSR